MGFFLSMIRKKLGTSFIKICFFQTIQELLPVSMPTAISQKWLCHRKGNKKKIPHSSQMFYIQINTS